MFGSLRMRLINKIKLVVCLPVFLLSSFGGIYSQDLVSPLDIPLYLSGNFGELRSNHFHSGIDFKTQSVTGIPVRSVKDGYISRISVSPYGYGRAIYITHPDGTTSVYAHLDKFMPEIQAAVRDSQYLKESFAVNLFFSSSKFPVKKGQEIAYSGNTGGSGGPHLHFEFRNTSTEKPFDPLPFFKEEIKDTQAPEIKSIMVFPQFNKGVVDGESRNEQVSIVKDKFGNAILNKIITAWGEIGVGLKAYDRMDETSNIYGVNEIILKVDGNEIYHSVMNTFSFKDTRYLNSYIDWGEWIENESFYMKSFTDQGNRLGINHSLDNGIIHIDKEKDYHLEYILKDIYDNTTTFEFSIAGVKQDIPFYESDDPCFLFNRNNEYNGNGISISVPRGNLYKNVYLDIDTIGGFTPWAPLYIIGDRIPLHTYCYLSLDIPDDIFPDKSKYGVVYNWKEKRDWLGGKYKNGRIRTKVRELGRFSIEVDTVPPVIMPTHIPQWKKTKQITFKITDDLSGISSYKATLNGEFILFEYDAKNDLLFYVLEQEKYSKEPQELRLEVTDEAGNISVYQKEIVLI